MCARGIRIVLDVDPKEPQPERIEPTEAQLRQEREELRRIVDLIPQQIVVLNPEGKAICEPCVHGLHGTVSRASARRRFSRSRIPSGGHSEAPRTTPERTRRRDSFRKRATWLRKRRQISLVPDPL